MTEYVFLSRQIENINTIGNLKCFIGFIHYGLMGRYLYILNYLKNRKNLC